MNTQSFEWVPKQEDLSKLLFRGSSKRKEVALVNAQQYLGKSYRWSELLLLCVGFMLEASKKEHIDDPVRWLFTCTYEEEGGEKAPWVAMAIARRDKVQAHREKTT